MLHRHGGAADTARPHGEKMQDIAESQTINRLAARNSTEAAIICQPFASSSTVCASDGVMRNFSSGGSYIETSYEYKTGTILIVRMIRYPAIPSSMADEEGLRSICLAEVKWRQELADENAIRYGIGLRYLD